MLTSEMDCPLTPKELYEFDVSGFLIIRNFLKHEFVRDVNIIIDEAHQKLGIAPHKFSLLNLHPIFLDLMTHHRVMRICKYMLGDWFRFDHAYGLQVAPAGQPGHIQNNDLHGGPKANQGSFRYHWHGNRPQCGLLVFSYIMEPAELGDGGLVVVPGSHKQNLPIEGRQVFLDMLGGIHDAWWVQQPVVEKGDLLIFTEALVHGSQTWKPRVRRRRNLYYKYTPGHLCWRDYDQIKPYVSYARTDLERDLLRPPFVAGYDEPNGVMGTNNWRGPTRIGA